MILGFLVLILISLTLTPGTIQNLFNSIIGSSNNFIGDRHVELTARTQSNVFIDLINQVSIH